MSDFHGFLYQKGPESQFSHPFLSKIGRYEHPLLLETLEKGHKIGEISRELITIQCFGSLHHSWQMFFEIYNFVCIWDFFQNYIRHAFCHVRHETFYNISPEN